MSRRVLAPSGQESSITHSAGGTSFVGEAATNVFACITVGHAMRLYAKTGIRAARNYTPTNMLRFVEQTTGKKFKRTQIAEAADWLLDWAKARRVTIKETSE